MESNNMKFSIIVPVYNAEKYLNRCNINILSQTYQNWELIYVDDGSVDNSWKIIQTMSANDARIKGIHQENGGPGSARNFGIENSTGDYIVFVDVDDVIDHEYLQLLKPIAYDNDIVFIDVNQIDLQGKVLREEKMSVYSNLSKEMFFRQMMTGRIPWGGVRKSVRRQYIQKYNIRFSNLKVGEEALFSIKTLLYTDKIGFLSERCVYMYEQHDNSQSNVHLEDPWGGTFEVIKDFLSSNNIYKKYADTLNAFNVSSTIVSFDRIAQYCSGTERKRKIKERFNIYKQRMDPNYKIDYKSLPVKAYIFIPCLSCGITFPVVLASQIKKIIKSAGRDL